MEAVPRSAYALLELDAWQLRNGAFVESLKPYVTESPNMKVTGVNKRICANAAIIIHSTHEHLMTYYLLFQIIQSSIPRPQTSTGRSSNCMSSIATVFQRPHQGGEVAEKYELFQPW
eukprot:20895-Heterococcus_DN1.PRE.3